MRIQPQPTRRLPNQALQNLQARAPASRLADAAERISAKIDTSELRGAAKSLSAGARFRDNAFGEGFQRNASRTAAGELRSGFIGTSRNPIDQQRSPFAGAHTSHVSDEPGKKKSGGGFAQGVKNFAYAVLGALSGTVGGTAFGVMSANDDPASKKNEADGIIGLARQGKRGTTNAAAAEELKRLDDEEKAAEGGGTKRTGDKSQPNPEAEERRSTTITGGIVKGILARFQKNREDADVDNGGGGGPLNGAATPAGQAGAVGMFTELGSKISAFNGREADAVIAKLQSKVDPAN